MTFCLFTSPLEYPHTFCDRSWVLHASRKDQRHTGIPIPDGGWWKGGHWIIQVGHSCLRQGYILCVKNGLWFCCSLLPMPFPFLIPASVIRVASVETGMGWQRRYHRGQAASERTEHVHASGPFQWAKDSSALHQVVVCMDSTVLSRIFSLETLLMQSCFLNWVNCSWVF